jgi:GT2 family glycosyltransferase
MHRAIQYAQKNHEASALFWLNDDTDLFPDAICRVLDTAEWIQKQHGREGIVVGATCDRNEGRLTYGGLRSKGRVRRFSFAKICSDGHPAACDTMNGNIVLIPARVAKEVGNLDPVFQHAMGDVDYGLRARRLGVPIYVAPGYLASCNANSAKGTFKDRSLPRRERWRKLMAVKGLPPQSWLQLTRRHGGVMWPLYFVWPYLSTVLK